MKTILVCAALLVVSMFSQSAATSGVNEPPGAQGHSSGLLARVTMRDGTVRQARIEGVGCTESICSRTAFMGGTDSNSVGRTWFDSIAKIREITPDGGMFVMKDRTTRRLTLRAGSRVLYLQTVFGSQDRIDLARVRSIDAVPMKDGPP